MAALLQRLPVTSKDELREKQRTRPPFGGWVREDLRDVARVFVSPGPIYNVEGRRVDDWGAQEALQAAGFAAGDLVLNTFTYHLSPASFIVEGGLRALGATVIPAGTGSKADLVRLLLHLPVTAFAGVPSYLKALLDEAAAGDGNGRSRLSLRKAWFTAEGLPGALRQHFQDVWGIEAFQGYGTAELGIVAYECRERDGLHLGSQVVVELLDPQTRQPVPDGEVGEVVVTSLRPAYPLVRLATGDLSRLITQPCSCGRRSPRLAGVLGRVGSGVKVRGMFVYPHQVEELARYVAGAARVVATVERVDFRDSLMLEVEAQPAGAVASAPGSLPEFERAVSQIARERLRVRPDAIRVVPPGSLEGRPALTDRRAG